MAGLLLLWITCLLFVLFTKNYKKEQFETCSKKEHSMLFLYPCALFVYEKLKFEQIAKKEQRAICAYRLLELKQERKAGYQWYVLKKLSIAGSIFFMAVTLALLLEVRELQSSKQQGVLVLSDTTAGTEQSLRLRMENGAEDELTITMPSLKEKTESEEEIQSNKVCEEAYSKSYEYIDQVILGDNRDLTMIGSKLNLVSEIPEAGTYVSWETSNQTVLDSSGEVHNEQLNGRAEINIMGTICSADGDKLGMYQVTVQVVPPTMYDYLLWKEELTKNIESAIQESEENTPIILPREFEGRSIQWVKPEDDKAFWFLLLGLVLSIVLYVEMDEDLQNRVKKRRKQMLYDYPNIINKLTLLIGAGMTVSGAWARIVNDYVKVTENEMLQNNKSGHKKKQPAMHYAYEEMRLTNQKLELGVSESIAFEEFGRRSGIVEYMKLSSVLIQNMRKGTQGLTQILSLMAQEAYEGRKQRARQLGEEAGTKLLLPMVIMLVLVMVIIMVPAFWSMRV